MMKNIKTHYFSCLRGVYGTYSKSTWDSIRKRWWVSIKEVENVKPGQDVKRTSLQRSSQNNRNPWIHHDVNTTIVQQKETTKCGNQNTLFTWK